MPLAIAIKSWQHAPKSYALAGRLDQAISLLSSASSQVNSVACNRPVTMPASISCASCSSATARMKDVKGEKDVRRGHYLP
ncbi:Uncharacterised protein [Leclercia adecarboxylata]|uniref:Uncharacterized protein n=1 Tax=Leclercia adecarboxylata TaxID=83655 RepID=A0A4U9IF04_9ENTR|nr:Uncharacterised protein [Leclercia adecarboxylata]